MRLSRKIIFAIFLSAAPTFASAQIFTGADNGASTAAQLTNSNAAAGNFDATAPGDAIVDFEGSLPTGYSFTGGYVTNNGPLGCTSLCGFNTTAGGQNFLFSLAEPVTFSFSTPINSFAFFMTGMQDEFVARPVGFITYLDESTEYFGIPSVTEGGGAFFGYVNPVDPTIASVTVNPNADYVGFDDFRFGVVPTFLPEPSTWAMMLLGFGAIGLSMRRRKWEEISAQRELVHCRGLLGHEIHNERHA